MKSGKRLFVALWPDMQSRNQISEVQKQAKITSGLMAGAVAYENLHMTLQFLGEVPVSAITRIESQLTCETVPPFHIVLDCWGHFSKSGILWLGSSEQVEALQYLHSNVVKATGNSLKSGKDKIYKPHVTLFRKVDHLPRVESFTPVEWLIDRFVLVESTMHPDGVKYRVLQEYLF